MGQIFMHFLRDRNKLKKTVDEILRRNGSQTVSEIVSNSGGADYIEIDSFGVVPFGESWRLRLVDSEECAYLLNLFIDHREYFGFGLSGELARLLAERGKCVADRIAHIVATTDWRSYGAHSMILAGLPWIDGGIEWAMKLLDIAPEDRRDGLFLAIWKMNDLKLNLKLLECFEKWHQEDGWGMVSGERGIMMKFLVRWANEAFAPWKMENIKKLREKEETKE